MFNYILLSLFTLALPDTTAVCAADILVILTNQSCTSDVSGICILDTVLSLIYFWLDRMPLSTHLCFFANQSRRMDIVYPPAQNKPTPTKRLPL